MWAVSGDDFGDRVRGVIAFGRALGREWARGAEGEMKKGSSDAEGAIG